MTTMAPHRPSSPPAGLTFCPPQNELTDLYLHRKIVGEALPPTGRFIHVADVYSAEPEKLVDRFEKAPGTGKGHDQPAVYYFFSVVRYAGGRKTNARGSPGRRSRTVDGGAGKHWHSEHGARPVKGGSGFGGYEQNFSYMARNASTGKDERAGWIMTEYGLAPEHGGGDLVLCKIHRSPNSSAAVPVPDHVVVGSRKRKAADCDHLEDPTAPSVRPRRTDEHDEQLLLPVESVEPGLTSVEDFAEQHQHSTGDEFIIFDEDPVAEARMKFPMLFDYPVAEEQQQYGAAQSSSFMQNMEHDIWSLDQNGAASSADQQPPGWSLDQNGAASSADQQPPGPDQAAHPSNFLRNMEQDIWSLDQICGLVAPSCSAGLVLQTVAAGNDNDQMDASLREEEPAANEAFYGLPCPAFSPEMIRRCSDNVVPWPSSPTSMSMFWGTL